MGIIIIAAIAVGAYLWYTRNGAPSKGATQERQEQSALEIVRERYARGEIDRNEFQELKAELSRDLK